MSSPMNPVNPVKSTQESGETRKDVFVKDLKAVVGDADALVKEAASTAVEELSLARNRIESGLSDAKFRAIKAREQVVERARGAAEATCAYVSDNPWKIVGMAALAGLVIGISLSRREGE